MRIVAIKLSLSALAIAALAVGRAGAAELTAPAVLKPVKGVSFDIGSKHAMTYYKPAGGICNLTLVMAERPNEDGTVASTASRISVPVLPGKTARIDTAEGKALEFACKVGGSEMTVKSVEQVAWTPKASRS